MPHPLEDQHVFDGRDNRRDLFHLLARIGHGLPEMEQARRRSRFLESLLPYSAFWFARQEMFVEPCCLADAYMAFVAITGALGVPITKAMELLEEEIRAQ